MPKKQTVVISSREKTTVSSLSEDYKKILAQDKSLVNDLDLKLFFQQAARWESGHVILRKRIDQKTFDASLAYVQSLLDEINGILDDESVAQTNKKYEIQAYLKRKDVVKQGAVHVAALDKNTPTTKRFKKYLGLGLLTTIGGVLLLAGVAALIGIFAVPLLSLSIVAAAVMNFVLPAVAGIAAIFGIAHVVAEGTKHEEKVHKAFMAIAIIPFAIFLPLVAGIKLLQKAHSLSKNRQGMSLGLASAFPALRHASHTESNIVLMPDQSESAVQTYDAKIAKARAKMEAFAVKSQPEDSANYSNYSSYAQEGFQYYSERVRMLEGMKTFEIERGLAISPKELAEKRCDLDNAEKTLYSALEKPNKNKLLAAKYALKFGSVIAESENKTVAPEIQAKINALPSVQNHLQSNKWDVHAGREPGYHRGVSLAHSLFMFERGPYYHEKHASKVAEAQAAKRL